MLDQLPKDILLQIGAYLGAIDEHAAWQEPLTIARAAAACMMASPHTQPIGSVAYGLMLRHCKMLFRGELCQMDASSRLEIKAALTHAGLPKTGTRGKMLQRLRDNMQPLCPVAPEDRERLTRQGPFATPAAGYLVPSDGHLVETQQACLRAFGGDIRHWASAALEAQRGRAQRRQQLFDMIRQVDEGRLVGMAGMDFSPACTQYVSWGIGDLRSVADRVCQDFYFYEHHRNLTHTLRKRMLQQRPELLLHQAETLAREHAMWNLALRFGSVTVANNINTPALLRTRLLQGDFEFRIALPEPKEPSAS